MWRACTPGECQGRAPAPLALGPAGFGDPKVLLASGVSAAPKPQCRAAGSPRQGQLQPCCPTMDLSWGGTQAPENCPAQLNGPRFALARMRNHWALFLFLHKGFRIYFALDIPQRIFSRVECRGWAGAAGGIALELLQAKENEAPLSPMQGSFHTLSFKVSWDLGMSQPRAPGAEVSPSGLSLQH